MRHRKSRKAFTLVELLTVIVILALLIGLLVPAVMRAVRTANVSAEAAQIRSVAQALAEFNNKYGIYPPSRIVISENGDYSEAYIEASLGLDGKQLISRSLTYLRRLWPRMALRTDGSRPTIPGGWYDANGDHRPNPPYILQGHECLALFLGGVPMKTDTDWVVTGLDKNPTNPFTSAAPPDPANPWPSSTNRTVPMFEGKIQPTGGGNVAFVGYYGYPLVYFSAYGGTGYDPDDVNFAETDDTTGLTMIGAMQASNAATPKYNTLRADIIGSPSPNPYTKDSPVPVLADDSLNTTDKRNRVYFNDKTFQIISAGADKTFGIGGTYNETASVTLPYYKLANDVVTKQVLGNGVRNVEKDNVTNFRSSSLD